MAPKCKKRRERNITIMNITATLLHASLHHVIGSSLHYCMHHFILQCIQLHRDWFLSAITVVSVHHCVTVIDTSLPCTTIIKIIVGHRLATKVFIGKLPATRGVWVIIG